LGREFRDTQKVTFGGVAATFKVLDRSLLSVVVPAAARTGPLAVTTPRGTATSSASFTVTQVNGPTLTAFTPPQGPVGTVVTLAGTGFTAGATVAFNGAAASAVTFVSATQLRATVPPGATSGHISVTTPAGTATSAAAFTVTQVAGPTLAAFTPAQGPVGMAVTLTGTGFTTGATVAFHGVGASAVAFVSATQLRATVPPGATSGPISVTTSAGTATSAAAFTVTQVAGPTLTAFTPAQGAVGTVVTLAGTGFTTGATVAFHGAAAPAVTFVSATQLKATVPPGATSGPISVTTSAGTATSAAAFTVGTAPSGVDLSIGGWYINQSVQTLGRSIPLVAGKDGYLRVFALANGTNALAPKVRVTLTGGSPSPWVQTITAPTAAVPTAVAEDSLGSSWNLAIPGSVLAVGGTLKVELDPDGAIPEANKANNTLTATLDARALPVFRTTIIPVTQQGMTANVTNGRTLASWAGMLNALYPIASVDVALGSPYTTQADLNSGSGGWSTLLGEINSKRVADGTGRYYFGAVTVNYSSGLAGLGYIGMPAAIGWDKNEYDRVFAHETGHNFNRQHAPCGVSGDPNWPTDAAHASAQIGVYGMDTRTGTAKAPSAFKDLMSYCYPVWVSDYTYQGVLAWRTAGKLAEDAASAPEEALPPRTDCLLVSGTVRHGQLALDPAYFVHTRPTQPHPGAYVLELKDRHGITLLRVPFGAVPIPDAPEGSEEGFAFAIPLSCPLQTAYQALRIVTPTGGLVQRNAGPGEVFQLPTATPRGSGVARIQWDAKAFPTAMIRDEATQEVLAFAKEGLLDLHTQAKVLEVTLSDGVRSKRFLLKVGE
jgi:hypothetical protein